MRVKIIRVEVEVKKINVNLKVGQLLMVKVLQTASVRALAAGPI